MTICLEPARPRNPTCVVSTTCVRALSITVGEATLSCLALRAPLGKSTRSGAFREIEPADRVRNRPPHSSTSRILIFVTRRSSVLSIYRAAGMEVCLQRIVRMIMCEIEMRVICTPFPRHGGRSEKCSLLVSICTRS